MPECLLVIAGETLDVDAMLGNSSFTPCLIWRRGEPSSRRSAPPHRDSGLKILVSGDTDVRQQIRDAISFLRENTASLKRLIATNGAETAIIDFGWSFNYEHYPAQFRFFPIELLSECVSIGLSIEVSVYASSSADDESIPQLK